MFGFVYALLFAVWVYVLNSKIQHGPDEDVPPPPTTSLAGLVEAAATLTDPAGKSLTLAKDDPALARKE
jgi:hypothetical protein